MKLLLEIIVLVLVVRVIVKLLLSWASKKTSVKMRYSPKQSEINERDIIDGEFEELKK